MGERVGMWRWWRGEGCLGFEVEVEVEVGVREAWLELVIEKGVVEVAGIPEVVVVAYLRMWKFAGQVRIFEVLLVGVVKGWRLRVRCLVVVVVVGGGSRGDLLSLPFGGAWRSCCVDASL